MVELLLLLRTWSQISVLVHTDLQMMKFLGEGGDNFLKLSSAMSDKDFLEKTQDDYVNSEVQPARKIIKPVSQLPYFISLEEQRRLTNAE